MCYFRPMLIGLLSVAIASELVIDAKVPVDIHHAGQPVARLAMPGRVHLDWEPGAVTLSFDVAGDRTELPMVIPPSGAQWVIVGRSGITTTAPAPSATPVIATSAMVEFRVSGKGAALIVLDGERHVVASAEPWTIELSPGGHTVGVRTVDGSYQWAQGTLDIVGGGPLILQVSEGRVPELSGDAGHWLPSSR